MKRIEIKKVIEYCWGSLVEVEGKETTEILLTSKIKYLGGAFVVWGLAMICLGFVLGRL